MEDNTIKNEEEVQNPTGEQPSSQVYFEDLPLDDRLLDALYDMRFDVCTPIQQAAIPAVLNGNDIIGIAQTGTGKTAAYLLPVLSLLSSGNYPDDKINCLIMSPTRELAQQIDQAVEGFSYYVPVSGVPIYGGNDGIRYEQERRGLMQGADIIIATPGRLISHLQLGNVDFSSVSFLILDEADRMLDMGFYDDIMQIVKQLPEKRQTLLFSATFPDKIQKLAKNLLHNPVEIKIAVSQPAEKIEQKAYLCGNKQKVGLIRHIFEQYPPERVIVFASSKQSVKELTIALKQRKFNVAEMHSDLEQKERDRVMNSFKARQTGILVATDIVSRGIDIDDLQMVINYDVPHHAEDYIHRIGRTARAGHGGMAFTFVNEKDAYYFKQIQSLVKNRIELMPLPSHLGAAPAFNVSPDSGRKKTGQKRERNCDKNRPSHRNRSRRNGRKQAPKPTEGKGPAGNKTGA